MKNLIRNILHDERGATAVEYGLIVSLIVISMVGALAVLGNSTTTMWNDVSNEVSASNSR
ncbi:Flp family type IVb pilin [Parasphingopyxis lamellibrachiae]|uniref:Pilus assembly protein Flp/PilA n=1 Tax=Parasphingopyxis lamellibrachiae TaxID=680125 RepID=A0A3D9FED0_9SPHN|nr:Flp family type IVb pilin [Parasphingopyxis lamellibrachiae]RED15922.1 pilus assembly protein Flp/PilA [Parasphingopyxis lamellibrachiae]